MEVPVLPSSVPKEIRKKLERYDPDQYRPVLLLAPGSITLMMNVFTAVELAYRHSYTKWIVYNVDTKSPIFYSSEDDFSDKEQAQYDNRAYDYLIGYDRRIAEYRKQNKIPIPQPKNKTLIIEADGRRHYKK